jgi:hypothetical protein
MGAAIGDDADRHVLRRFVGKVELQPYSGGALVDLIRWAPAVLLA